MSKIYIFDVDGTLTPSRQPMTKKFKKFFLQWALKNTFYLVTGSDLLKLQEQMNGMEYHSSGIFTCCGNQFWREGLTQQWPTDWKLIYENIFTPPESLIDYLEKNFPNKSPDLKDSERQIWYKAGQASVVSHLKMILEQILHEVVKVFHMR